MTQQKEAIKWERILLITNIKTYVFIRDNFSKSAKKSEILSEIYSAVRSDALSIMGSPLKNDIKDVLNGIKAPYEIMDSIDGWYQERLDNLEKDTPTPPPF